MPRKGQILILSLLIAVVGAQLHARSQLTGRDVSQEHMFALRQGGLRAAAKITGNYVGAARFHSETVAADLETLVYNSTAVILGEIGDNLCRLSANGREITTDYNVTVFETFKGAAPIGSSIMVSIPGGRVGFEDGTWAELLPEDFRLPRRAERYVLFLERSRYDPTEETQTLAAPLGVFSPTFGSQGVFFVTPDSLRVRPRGRRTDLVVARYWETDYPTLLLDLRSAVAAAQKVRK